MTVLPAALTGVLTALAALLLTGRLRSVAAADSRLYDLRAHVGLALLLGFGAGAVAATWAEALALGLLALACALLIVVDVVEHRLPNAILGPAYPVLLAAFLLAAVLAGSEGAGTGARGTEGGGWPDLGRAVLAALVLLAVYLLLALLAPAGLGMGDVKFSGLLGLALGWSGWDAVLAGTVAAFLINALIALVVLVVRRDRRAEVPFGPSMVLGAAVGLALTLG